MITQLTIVYNGKAGVYAVEMDEQMSDQDIISVAEQILNIRDNMLRYFVVERLVDRNGSTVAYVRPKVPFGTRKAFRAAGPFVESVQYAGPSKDRDRELLARMAANIASGFVDTAIQDGETLTTMARDAVAIARAILREIDAGDPDFADEAPTTPGGA